MSDNPVLNDIQAAVAILQNGDRALARVRFDAIWSRIRDGDAPYLECLLAHFMADAQDAVAEELEWDLRALAAAQRCRDSDGLAPPDHMPIDGFFPSLYLNLADAYHRLGDLRASLRHLAQGRAVTAAMPDTPYYATIRGGFERLAARLASS